MDHAANDEDRILRSFVGVIDATLRTNYYQTGKQGQLGSCISLSLIPRRYRICPGRAHTAKFLFTAPVWKACICVLVLWLVVVCAGLIGVKIATQGTRFGGSTDGEKYRHRSSGCQSGSFS